MRRSNLNMVEGDWVAAGSPLEVSTAIPGHQIVVVWLRWDRGSSRSARTTGSGCSRDGRPACTCEFCLTGGEYFCTKKEILGETVDGGVRRVHPPAMRGTSTRSRRTLTLSLRASCLGDGDGAVKKAPIEPGKKVAVFGVGGVGHLAIQFVEAVRADVYAVTRSELHLARIAVGHAHRLQEGPVGGAVLMVKNPDQRQQPSPP